MNRHVSVLSRKLIGPMNFNPFFETDSTGWTNQNCTIARSTAQAHQGVASLLITPDGVAASGGAIAQSSFRIPIESGFQYEAAMWAWTTLANTQVAPAIDWWTALTGGQFISTGFVTAVIPTAQTWTLISGVLTAPGNAVGANVRARHSGTPTAAQTWHADEVTLKKAALMRRPAVVTALGAGELITCRVRRHGEVYTNIDRRVNPTENWTVDKYVSY